LYVKPVRRIANRNPCTGMDARAPTSVKRTQTLLSASIGELLRFDNLDISRPPCFSFPSHANLLPRNLSRPPPQRARNLLSSSTLIPSRLSLAISSPMSTIEPNCTWTKLFHIEQSRPMAISYIPPVGISKDSARGPDLPVVGPGESVSEFKWPLQHDREQTLISKVPRRVANRIAAVNQCTSCFFTAT
jgi:hypothetical protein